MYLTIFIFGMDKKRVLFIIKERNVYGIKSASYGLVNSAQFVVNALIKSGIEAKVVQVIDSNGLRLLKNHCQQAFWAIQFANKINKKLHFHVNVSEHETNQTSPVLKNLKAIFKDTNHKLIEHTWMPHEDFIELVKKMDFGMQLSFTETFNIVAADFVGSNVPIIVSNVYIPSIFQILFKY